MGVSVSRYSDVAENEFLVRFCSDKTITPNDPFWNQLLSYNVVPPKNAEEQLFFDASTEKLLNKFIESNLQTGNLGSLVRVFIARASELLSSPTPDNAMLAWQTFNALFVIRSVAKYLIETVPEYQVCQHFDVATEGKSSEQQLVNIAEKTEDTTQGTIEKDSSTGLMESERTNGIDKTLKLNANESNLEMLIDALVGLIIDVPVTDNTYYLHLECLNTLLVLMSVYMFAHVHGQTRNIESSLIFRTLYQGRYSMHAPLVVGTLLNNLSEMRAASDHMFGVGGARGSLVLGLASGLWSMLTLSTNRTTSIYSTPADDATLPSRLKLEHPVANQSCLLLLCLTNHCCDDNEYRRALLSCVDSNDASTTNTNKTVTNGVELSPLRIDMAALHKALCATASCEHSTLLLYLMLHACAAYKKYVSTVGNIENLLLPILRCLYSTPDSNSHHIYMSLIIVLILSEDDALNKSLHNIMIKNPTWYTERSLSEISLGGLAVLVILRTVQHNILRVRDKYLHTNCLAALANMSSEFRNLHPYVAQRLVSLYEVLSKRKKRLEEKMNSGNMDGVKGMEITPDMDWEDRQEALWDSVYVLSDVQRMLLEIINSCVSNQLPANANLVYALLYNKRLLSERLEGAEDMIRNIEMVVGFFTSRLQRVQDAAGGDLGVNEVLATIRKGIEQWSNDRLKKLPSLKFRYVEEDRPSEFFTPYVWSLVAQCGVVCWASEAGAKANSHLVAC